MERTRNDRHEIHPQAMVATGARIGARVKIGAYAIVGEHVELGEGCMLDAHAVVQGPAVIGRHNVFHPFCSIGGDPQDLKFHGEQTELIGGRWEYFSGVCDGEPRDGGRRREDVHREWKFVHGVFAYCARLSCGE